MAEKSGIQMIEEILGNQVIVDRRLQVVEHLLKELLATKNEIQESSEATIVPATTTTRITPAPNARVTGKVVKGGKPVLEVDVTIHDDKGNPIKKTRTNRSGEWIASLPPGQYSAVFEGKATGTVTFAVNQGDKMVRVGQLQTKAK